MKPLKTSVTGAALIAAFICYTLGDNELLHRTKRFYLVDPMGGLFKLVVGIAIPVKLGLKQSLIYGLNFQFQYWIAQNITQLQQYPPIISKSRERRDFGYGDRAIAYLGFEALMKRYDINGRACLLRSICENSMASLKNMFNGLYGHLLHIILTPDYGDGKADPDLDPVYLEAQEAGRFGVDCTSLYPDCPYGNGVLDIISLQF